MKILVIDTLYPEKIIDILSGTNPGIEYVQSTGEKPFPELKAINDGEYSAIIVGTPAMSYHHRGHKCDYAVEWIEALRFGAVWGVDWTKSNRYAIKETTKSSLPIVYVHQHSILDLNQLPSDFPDVILTAKSKKYSKSRLTKFVHKWYKSLGANSVVIDPWEPLTLSQALNDALGWEG